MKITHTYFLLILTTTIIMMVMQEIRHLHMHTSRQTFIYSNDCNAKREIRESVPTLPPPYTNGARNISHGKKYATKGDNLVACDKLRELLPQHFQGRIYLTEYTTAEDVRNEAALSKVLPGGMYRPSNCLANGGTAVIIPYRDRPQHLDILVFHLHNMLQRQKLHYGIFVVEISLPAQFNRGMLANAGFLTANSFSEFDCFIIHDVDLLPVNDKNVYTCDDNYPKHLVASSSKFPNGLPYSYYTGGVLAMTQQQYILVNGYSNIFFGWGGEDDDIYERIKLASMNLTRPLPDIGSYVALNHTKDSSNPPNPHRHSLLRMAKYRAWTDGLNSIKHQRKALEFRPYYTWVLIDCVESESFKDFPYIEADQNLMHKSINIRHIKNTPRLRVIKIDHVHRHKSSVVKTVQ